MPHGSSFRPRWPRIPADWSYHKAFSSHRGLISPAEQTRLRESTVAVAGLGGVGGVHLVTLARMGVRTFHIADPDCFELANFNRQYGARTDTLGRAKAEVMAEEIGRINPEAKIGFAACAPITESNVGSFLDGVDVLIDGLDFFAMAARRLVFREARRRGIWAVTAGPIGLGAALLVFDPEGMAFDDYFDTDGTFGPLDEAVAFAAGLTPRSLQAPYLDLSQVDLALGRGPSAGLSCQLCAGLAAAETLKILLGRGTVRPAPS